MTGADPALSVVIPTYRPVENLDATLQALAAGPPGLLEVVVVLDGPDNGRSAALSHRAAKQPVVVVQSPGRGRAAACNAGVRKARGDVILLLDDDMVPEPDAVAAHLARHRASAPVALVGAAPVDPRRSRSIAARYIGRRFDRHLVKLAALGSITDVRDVYTGSFSLRRGTFLDVGGFDERFTEYGNEDGEFAGRLMADDIMIEFAAEAVTRQGYSKTFVELAGDNMAKGRTAQQFLARHPDRSAESAVMRRRRVSPKRRVVRAMVRRLVASEARRTGMVRATEWVATSVERARPATADKIIDVLLDGCFWAGVSAAQTSAPTTRLTVVHYLDGAVAGGVERMALTLAALTDRQRWRPVLVVHESPGLAATIRTARDQGLQVEVLPPRSGPKGLWTILGLAWRLRRLNPAVVHVHRSWAMSGTAGVVAAALARCDVTVATEHLFNPGTRPRAFRVRRVLDRVVDCHVAVSGSLATVLRDRFGLSPSAIEVVHNGVLQPDRPSGHAVEELRRQWLSAQARAVLVPARLDKNKGHATLLAALKELPDVLAVLAGEGPERERLERLADSLGVTSRVRFLGHRDDVPTLMTAADLVVLPSNVEGLPLVLLEASALGRPIVASNVDGVGEIVEDQVSGLLTPPGDPAVLADALRAALEDPEQSSRLGEAARDRFLARFTADRMVRSYEQLYERLLLPDTTAGGGLTESARLRALDWRFLTGRHHFRHAAHFSAPVEVERALGEVGSVATTVVSGAGADRGSVDLAVAVGPSVTELKAMDTALRDGGSLVLVARGTPNRLLARWNAAGLSYEPQIYLRWAWAGRTRAWLPVHDGVARLRVTSRPLPQPLGRKWLRAWLGWWRGQLRWWRRRTPAAELFLVATKPGPADGPPAPSPDDWCAAVGLPQPGRMSFGLLTGGRESISKAVGLLTETGTFHPGVVVKWPRTAAAGRGLAREGDNLHLLAQRGAGSMRLRVPTLVREHLTDVGPALVESMLDGTPLVRSLNRSSHHTIAIGAADILVDFARQTGKNDWSSRDGWWRATVAPIESRFIELVGEAVDPQLLNRARRVLADMDALPGCMEHRDMGPWNVLVDGDGHWQAADWESSVGAGLPLTDLWYFLTWAALSVEHLFEGSLARSYEQLTDPLSPTGRVSEAAVERYAAAMGLDRAAVDALRVLTWMIHVPSEVDRLERAGTPLRPDTLRCATFVRLWDHEVRRMSS